MKPKELLIELCDNLQKELNLRDGKEIHRVELQSGLKPEGYFTPMMHIGTSKTLPNDIRMALFVEVWVDGECIFREVHVPLVTESLEVVEEFLITKVLRHIFTFGVMSSKEYMDELKRSEI